MDEVVALCKRRGLIFPASEIYGGIANTYDYGHYGVLLKRNVTDAVVAGDDPGARRHRGAGLGDHPAPAHVGGLGPPRRLQRPARPVPGQVQAALPAGPRCRRRRRSAARTPSRSSCPVCGGDLTEPRAFNLMFQTTIGPVQEEGSTVYLRPETAQAMFVDFLNVQQSTGLKVPFGIAQMGKSFRNEVKVEKFIFRSLRVRADGDGVLRAPGRGGPSGAGTGGPAVAWGGGRPLGVRPESACGCASARHGRRRALQRWVKLRHRLRVPVGLGPSKRASRAAPTTISPRTAASGKNFVYFDQEAWGKDPATGKQGWHYVPHVVEPAAGWGRTRGLLALLCEAYDYEEPGDAEGKGARTVLRLHPRLAPIKDGDPSAREEGRHAGAGARDRRAVPSDAGVNAKYDEGSNAIGKRYARHDEIGTPYALTVDHADAGGQDRHVAPARRSLSQVRVPVAGLGGPARRARVTNRT